LIFFVPVTLAVTFIVNLDLDTANEVCRSRLSDLLGCTAFIQCHLHLCVLNAKVPYKSYTYTIVRAVTHTKSRFSFSDSRGSETTQPMKMKFCTIDDVSELGPHAKFGRRAKRGVFWA